jgi:hypothetical protein
MTPLILHLYKSHFTINDIESPIKLTTLGFADAINNLQIPALIPFKEEHYENGKLVVDIYDYRFHEPSKPTRLWLEPTPETIEKDIERFIELNHKCEIDSVEIESKILNQIYPKLDLSLKSNFNDKLLKHYNAKKYLTKSSVASNPLASSVQAENKISKRNEFIKIVMLLDKGNLEFYPRFNQYNFVQEWRRNKDLADQEQLIGLGDKNKIKINPLGNVCNLQLMLARKMLVYNMNRRIIRTLRFESSVGGETINTMLNVYELPEGTYEAVLRWGVDGTSVKGDTLRYPIGNKQAVEYYVAHFKGFYGLRHKLVSDSAEQRQ